jgi:glycosyltransferase involved in cell wall biosynthesis
LRLKRLRVHCAGFLQISRQGLIKPFKECYEVPFAASTSNYVINFLLNPILSFVITLVILIIRPKVVVISIPDPFPVLASYLGCSITRSKFIIDVRDPQEEIMIHTYREGLPGSIAKLHRRINYNIYRRAHAVIGVTRTLVTMLAREILRPIYYVPNGADLDVFKSIGKEGARKNLGLDQDSMLITYIGYLHSYGYYDILPVVTVVQRVKERFGINVKLVAAGPIYDDGVKSIFERFKDELKYVGVLDTGKLVMLLSACDIGIIPRVEDPIYDYAVPAKFYEHVAMGLPLIVIANRKSELAKIVEENKLGFVCEPKDRACLEASILTLANNKNLLNELKRNTLVFRKHIDRRIGAERLYRLIRELLQE